MRFLGVDVGAKRVGIAVSDDDGRVAVPSESVEAHTAVEHIVRLAPEHVVIGLPLDLNGKEGLATRKARKFAEKLENLREKEGISFQIHWVDERFSSVVAGHLLTEAGLSQKRQRGVVDALAASQILQGFLDSRNNDGSNEET